MGHNDMSHTLVDLVTTPSRTYNVPEINVRTINACCICELTDLLCMW